MADNELDSLDRWLNEQVLPLPPPEGTFELITRRARRRKIRKAVISAASAAAVAAAVAIAVPLGLSLKLTTGPTNARLAAGGSSATSVRSQSAMGTAGKQTTRPSAPSGTASAASASGTAPKPLPAPRYLPPNFQPSSVSWDSASTGWVIGPAGTPGHCDNPSPGICTSVARTDDGGLTWRGLPAPDAGSPDGPAGVSGIRFLDGVNGWAFGPELWATHNGGQTWTKIATGGMRVTDLETAGNRVYALFARCSVTNAISFTDGCTSYTLMSAAAGSDQWAPAGAATSGLASQGAAASGMIALLRTTGYLAAPDGTLYAGRLGGTWKRAGTMPCQPGAPQGGGLPSRAQIALSSPTRLAMFCDGGTPASAPKVYASGDSGATWTPATAGQAVLHGRPASITATSAGALVLATDEGIYLLPQGATRWQASRVTGSPAPRGGFSYVGMTTAVQGVALPADTTRHAIWMTTDGGVTWRVRPIHS